MQLPDLSHPPVNCMQGPWWRLNPWPLAGDTRLQALASYLNRAETQQALARCEETGDYPQAIRCRLHELGLSTFFVNAPTNGVTAEGIDWTSATIPHLSALSLLCTAASTSLGIDVGVNGLGLMPIYLGADAEQLRWVAERMASGAFCSLLLTEMAHGSNLLANETYAESGTLTTDGHFVPLISTDRTRQPSHYRLGGRKDLINGGSRHELLVLFARTGEQKELPSSPLAARSDFSLFLVDRERHPNGIRVFHRWRTLPAPAADISSVGFQALIVPAATRIGAEGRGFSLVQKTLGLTRGGVSSFAVGLAGRAVQLAGHYAQSRQIYDGPILNLRAITDHLLRMRALEYLVTAMSLKAIAMLNGYGQGGVHQAAVAKYACCALAEELVDEGRLLHGANALLLDRPYHRLIGDALLFGAFDGTSHLVLDQIQWRLAQVAVQAKPDKEHLLDQMRLAYRTGPQPLIKMARQRSKTILICPVTYLEALMNQTTWAQVRPIGQMSAALLALVRYCRQAGLWDQDQGLRFELGKLFAWLETIIALIELVDPDVRQALGPAHSPDLAPSDQALYTFTLGWFGGRLLAELRTVSARVGWPTPTGLAEADQALGALYRQGRDVFCADPQLLLAE